MTDLDDAEWWTRSDLAYRKGWEDGQQAMAEGWAADYPQHVRRAQDGLQAAEARRAADRPGPRPGDFPGIADLDRPGRRDLYRVLLNTWEIT